MSARLVRLLIGGALLLTFVVVPASPAAAHARLVSSEPAGGATIDQPPSRIAIGFSESIESSFGGVQVFHLAGVRVETGVPAVTGSRLDLPLPSIGPAGTTRSHFVSSPQMGTPSRPATPSSTPRP